MIISTDISDARGLQIDAIRNLHPQAERILYYLVGRADHFDRKLAADGSGVLGDVWKHYAEILAETFEDSCSAVHGELR